MGGKYMSNLFIAVHNDDEALFGSYIILRNKPIKVVVCTDGILHKERFNIDPETRRQESRDACRILGCEVDFLGLSDKKLVKSELEDMLMKYDPEMVFAPAVQGGHRQHDAVSDVATRIWGDRVVYYSTYTKENLVPEGEIGLVPTRQETVTKIQALNCYKSQHGINKPHFDAVMRAPEYLSYIKS